MVGLDPTTQRARVCGRKRIIGAPTRACWMAGSRPAMTRGGALDPTTQRARGRKRSEGFDSGDTGKSGSAQSLRVGRIDSAERIDGNDRALCDQNRTRDAEALTVRMAAGWEHRRE